MVKLKAGSLVRGDVATRRNHLVYEWGGRADALFSNFFMKSKSGGAFGCKVYQDARQF